MADKAAVGVMKEKPNPQDQIPETDADTGADADAGSGADAESPAGGDGNRDAGVRERDPVRVVAIVLVAIAVVAAAWAGLGWYSAENDASLAYSKLRDEVLQSGEQAVQNLNTLDYRTLDTSLKSWQDSTTGKMYQDIVQGRATFEQETQKAKTVTKARILEGALTELDAHAGKARIIVAIEIVVTPPTGAPATKEDRYIAELTRTSAGWKVSALGPAPVGNF